MAKKKLEQVFSEQQLTQIFPESLADSFFEALFGDVSEGSYDIRLVFDQQKEDRLEFQFHLVNRPGKCLRCNLTYGLPDVFSRHPIINVNGIAEKIGSHLNGVGDIDHWELGKTREISDALHIIPLTIFLKTS